MIVFNLKKKKEEEMLASITSINDGHKCEVRIDISLFWRHFDIERMYIVFVFLRVVLVIQISVDAKTVANRVKIKQ